MISTPSTTNSEAGKVDTGIKIGADVLIATVENMIIADVPALALPVIKTIWEFILGRLAGYFVRAIEIQATFIIIDHQVSGEEKSIAAAFSALIAAKRSGDPDAVKKAIQDYADAQSALIRDDGSAHAN